VLTYAAVGVLHSLAVSVSIRHSTALLIGGLLAWPIALLVILQRNGPPWGEAPLPVASAWTVALRPHGQ
jgi:hypothetical protein